MNSFILDSLNYFYTIKDASIFEYKISDELYKLMPVIYIKENGVFVKKVYNILGYLNKENNIFTWSWSTNIDKYKHAKINQLVLHGINMEPSTLIDVYTKQLLLTNNIQIYNNYQFIIILAISYYLTKANYWINNSPPNSNYYCYYILYDIKDVEDVEI